MAQLSENDSNARQERRGRSPLSKALQVQIFRDDKWLCRYCERPVIFAPAMKFLQQFVQNHHPDAELAYWSSAYRRDASPLLVELAAMIDHVESFSGGGSDERANLVTACYECNTRKSNMGASEFLKKHPPRPVKGKYGDPKHWDGFSTLFVTLLQQHRDAATRNELEWYEALKDQSL